MKRICNRLGTKPDGHEQERKQESHVNPLERLTAAAHLRREPTADLETLLLSYLLNPANDEISNPDARGAASGAAALLGSADRGRGTSPDFSTPTP